MSEQLRKKMLYSVNQVFYHRHKCEKLLFKCLNFIIKSSHLPLSKDDKVSLLKTLV
jgi:hypothetical protein